MRRRRKPSKKVLLKRKITINHRINGEEFRVLDEEGGVVGILSREEAFTKARESDLDLVEIAPHAKPPVVKLISFNKYLYQLAKKSRLEKKGRTETKEIKIGLFMADHDIERLRKKAAEFLKEGNQVRLSLWLKGRELAKKDQARAFMALFVSQIGDCKMVTKPSMQGKVMRTVISYEKQKNEQAKN